MMMRFRGGGVGHTSTRNATNHFLADCHPTDSAFRPGNFEERSEVEVMHEDTSDSNSEEQGNHSEGEQGDDSDEEQGDEEDVEYCKPHLL